jgi:hypothetical protein
MANAQVVYITDSSHVRTLTNRDRANLETFKTNSTDTSLSNIQNYFPKNTSGNLGLPSAPLFLKYQQRSLGFKFYQAPYENDMITEDQVTYYQTKGPFGSLTGIAGSKQEQLFRLLFTHTFKNRLNLTLRFNRYSGIGFYKRQNSFIDNLYASTNYTAKNGRAGYYAFFLFNKLKHNENGGISNDSLFQLDVSITKQLLPVSLSAARRDVRFTTVEVNPWFRLNKTNDSSTVLLHVVDYKLNYSGNYNKYIDNGLQTDRFYLKDFLDTVRTFDSTHWRTITNSGRYTLNIRPLFTSLQLGIKNEYTQFSQFTDTALVGRAKFRQNTNLVFINNTVEAGLFVNTEKFTAFVKTAYIYQGSNQNDYLVEAGVKYRLKIAYDVLKVPFVISAKASIEKRHPDLIYNYMFGNHVAWRNNFSPTDKTQGILSISTADNRFEIGALVQNTDNQLFFNSNANPVQVAYTIKSMALFVRKDLLFFKHLGLNLGYVYQATTNDYVISIPKNVATGALYYQGNLFKKALNLQIGFSAQYFSEFYGYNYMPATNVFYTQNDRSVGNYPYIDFFLNARIKPVRIFVKIDHVAQGFLGNKYSLSPGYLQNDRAFKFGINWIFFD